VDDAVEALTRKDDTFEHHDGLTDTHGIVHGLAAQRGPDIAWFKDPAGNILSAEDSVRGVKGGQGGFAALDDIGARHTAAAGLLRPLRCGGTGGCHRVLAELALAQVGGADVFVRCADCDRWQPRPPSGHDRETCTEVRCRSYAALGRAARVIVPPDGMFWGDAAREESGRRCGALLAYVRLTDGAELFLPCRQCGGRTYVHQGPDALTRWSEGPRQRPQKE
jgi:hypothetical protein